METVALVEQVRFDALFTFIFSPRPGTPAAKLDDPVPRAEKQVWFDRLCDAQNKISRGNSRPVCGPHPPLLDRRPERRQPLAADGPHRRRTAGASGGRRVRHRQLS